MSRAPVWMIMAWLVFGAISPALSGPAISASLQSPSTDSCDSQKPGDANGENVITIDDARYIMTYLCNGGHAPFPRSNGDPNGDALIDSLDVDYLVAYHYYGGPAPVQCTSTSPATGSCYTDTCAIQHPGDVNNDGVINVGDPVMLVNFLERGGPVPRPLANSDANGDCVIDFGDVTCLIITMPPCSVYCTCLLPFIGQFPKAGDTNHDNTWNVGDAVYVINYVFKGGPAPVPYRLYSGDANCDCMVNVGDAVAIINYVFKSGSPPCSDSFWLSHCGEPIR